MSQPDPLLYHDLREAADRDDVPLLPATPSTQRIPKLVFGVAPSGSCWVDVFEWYCTARDHALCCAISAVLDEIARIEQLERQRRGEPYWTLGSEWTQDAINACWKLVRANTGKPAAQRAVGELS